jgi:hypothetical protein
MRAEGAKGLSAKVYLLHGLFYHHDIDPILNSHLLDSMPLQNASTDMTHLTPELAPRRAALAGFALASDRATLNRLSNAEVIAFDHRASSYAEDGRVIPRSEDQTEKLRRRRGGEVVTQESAIIAIRIVSGISRPLHFETKTGVHIPSD